MTISKIKDLLSAEVLADGDLSQDVSSACGSDMMSDVLAYVKDQAVLLTGLVNTQVVRTAEMMDMICIVFVRNKRPTGEMIDLAMEHGIVLLSTSSDVRGVRYTLLGGAEPARNRRVSHRGGVR